MHPPNRKEQTKILLVDDDVDFMKSAKQCLHLQGNYSIETAFSVDEALDKMTNKETGVIVCDIQMPVTDGFEFLKKL